MTAGAGVIHFEMPDKERIYSYGGIIIFMHLSYGLTCHDVMK
jgi:redox-sensitive bicupin YhaK (pirin superfamily)